MTKELTRGMERRSKSRFSIQRDLRYKLVERDRVVAAATGQTLDISSSGVAFSVDVPVPAAGFVELSISWPVLLDETCAMRLIIFGRIVRNGRVNACTVEKYEFRTEARRTEATVRSRDNGILHRWPDTLRKDNPQPGVAANA